MAPSGGFEPPSIPVNSRMHTPSLLARNDMLTNLHYESGFVKLKLVGRVSAKLCGPVIDYANGGRGLVLLVDSQAVL